MSVKGNIDTLEYKYELQIKKGKCKQKLFNECIQFLSWLNLILKLYDLAILIGHKRSSFSCCCPGTLRTPALFTTYWSHEQFLLLSRYTKDTSAVYDL